MQKTGSGGPLNPIEEKTNKSESKIDAKSSKSESKIENKSTREKSIKTSYIRTTNNTRDRSSSSVDKEEVGEF